LATDVDISTSVTIVTIGYRARCTEPGCRNLGRVILRHADAGGRPFSNSEFCHDQPTVPVAQVNAFAEEMTKAGADWQIVSYGGAKHAFTYPDATTRGIED
jgi:hypothetical protein